MSKFRVNFFLHMALIRFRTTDMTGIKNPWEQTLGNAYIHRSNAAPLR